MLALLGLMGAVVASVLGEGVMGMARPADNDDSSPTGNETDPVPGPLSEEQYSAEPDLLTDEPAADDGIVTDDIEDEEPLPLLLTGTDADDLIDGGAAGDRLDGGAGDDQFNARGGDDRIDGGAGNDLIWAGAGDDLALGEEGDDTIHGQDGDDTLYGGEGDDWLAGHTGDDLLDGGTGDDSLLGGAGNDLLYGGEGDDWLAGNDGSDTLLGGPGQDTLDGGAGNDVLYGVHPDGDDGQPDFLNGGDGDDVLWLGAGDIGTGGLGADDFIVTQWLGEGGYSTIADYDSAEDQIVVVYDPAIHASPSLSLETGEAGDTFRIILDGQVVATVHGQVELTDIQLLAA